MANVTTETITLNVADATTMNAYVATPEGPGKAPAIMVFQEIFGVNPNIRNIAERFAAIGYVAIAPELFHRTAPGFITSYSDLQACMPHMQAMTPDGNIADARAAYDWLQKNPRVAPNATASIGFCMGGRVSFLANSALPLSAAISFYGTAIAPGFLSRAAQQHGPALFFWGGLDTRITRDQTRAVMDAMTEAKKTFVNVDFSDADHGFFCDARANHNERAARQAWDLLVAFLKTYVNT
jgi:carboxymethylenebutenolidase